LIQAGSKTYTYDLNGNQTGAGYVIGTDNELHSDGTWDYDYDAVGNMTSQVGITGGSESGYSWTYGYNDANQMTSAVESFDGVIVQEVTYTYDVFGNRIGETVINSSGTTTQEFSYSGGTLYADLNSSGTVETRFVSGVGGPEVWLAQVNASGRGAWLLSDHLGSVRTVVSLTGGTVMDQVNYDAFGNISSETDASQGSQLKYAGGQYDATTGQYIFGAREYNPADQRWDEQDPLGLQPGLNPYQYVGNAPTNGTDPTGQYVLPVNE
jgi:RHS repeat-associated protein